MIRITSKKDNFARCGIRHPAKPTEYPDARFTSEELERLKAEPMLVVEIFKDGDSPQGPEGNLRQPAQTVIAKIGEAETPEAVFALVSIEDRKTVLAAVQKRLAELAKVE